MSDVDNKVKMIVEGLLLAAGRPLSLDNISQVFSEDERPDRAELKSVMTAIAEDCNDRGFELAEVASGYRFQVRQELGEWIGKLWEEKPPRYTRALLETLALVAYRQPITRGDIEEIRGVTVSSNIIRTLLDREWIRVVGHRDVPGRPAMFATTRQFLDYFNLKSLQELPPLSEIKALESAEPQFDLAEGLASQRVIELPDEAEMAEEELSEEEKAQLLAEEEAIELSRKPLDEILNLGATAGDDGDEAGDDDDDQREIPRSLAQVIPIKPDIKTGMQGVNDDEADGTESAVAPESDSGAPADEDMSETFVLEDEEEMKRDFSGADNGEDEIDEHSDENSEEEGSGQGAERRD